MPRFSAGAKNLFDVYPDEIIASTVASVAAGTNGADNAGTQPLQCDRALRFQWTDRVRRGRDEPPDVRLSLRTAGRKAARDKGAALTAVTPGVLATPGRPAKQKTYITEQAIQTTVKAMYEERLTEVYFLRRCCRAERV
ncbi:hypothetical protein J2Y58_001276 [Sphingomonas sp. BE138]|uniref:hypothetical protein n=1 Tax=Sphingomonas sp. BE138 TaxID=2817845 RepID=UPI00285AD7B9|nr:hypothetical protein [Sphingomonas sp. BE138]MDR6787924.1 hypothetical protein [Sphingomonas sp. BE138]